MQHQVVILGAGPAGSAAAATLARAGLSVALIDKASFPRDKLCGGLFTGRSLKQYREIFRRDPPEALLEARDRIEFLQAGQALGRMDGVPPMYLTMRWDLDHHLLREAAAAGAQTFLGVRAKVDLAAQDVRLNSGEVLRYDVLIGADGVNSAVARALYGRAYDPETIGFALEAELPPPPQPDQSALQIDFGAAEWGYGWRFPKSGSTTVGVGGIHAKNHDMKGCYNRYTGGAHPKGTKLKGHFLPFGDFRNRPGRGNVILVGDAAGFVDPITGEGIAHAMESGALGAKAAIAALSMGQPETTARRYIANTRHLRRSLRIARGLRPVIFSDQMAPIFRRSFAGKGRLRHDYMRMLAGETEYPALLRRAVSRAPVILWRSLVKRGFARN